MLRLGQDGSISLTIKDKIIATLDSIAVAELSPADLVRWENGVRLSYYESQSGFWSEENQRAARGVEVSEERQRAYPDAKVETLEAHNAYWDFQRTHAVDN